MTDSLKRLRSKIENRDAVLGVIGLGYVGLPVACLFAEAGFRVVGVDLKADRVALINAGHSPIEGNEPGLSEVLSKVVHEGRLTATTDYSLLGDADVITINVETPVGNDHRPRYEALRTACSSLGSVLKPGALVIVESTISPGTMAQVVRPALEELPRGGADADFFLGHCPERVMPGKLLSNLRNLSRVCGGTTPETAEAMVVLYRQIIRGDLDVADCVTAELVKTAENAYRDVNIAFANELALICENVGGDVWKVRELVNKSPGRNVLVPGAGVGGHCIPKDPWLLAHGASDETLLQLVPAARAVNDHMPLHVASLVEKGLARHGRRLASSRIAVMGYAYLENSDDTRNSPSDVLVDHFRTAGAEVVVHDPFVAEYRGNLPEAARGADAAVFMVAHDAYRQLDLARLATVLRTPVLVDARHVFDENAVRCAGLTCLGIGVSS